MATYELESIKDNQDNEFVFKLKSISYVNGLDTALAAKANNNAVVHLVGNETIYDTKTFDNSVNVNGVATISALTVTGNETVNGTLSVSSTITGNTNIISKGSVQSRRTSYPLVGAMRVDSNGDQTGYAKLEVDNANKLMLVCAAESGSSDTKVIRYANSQYEFYGAAESVIDYGNTSRRLKIGYSGDSLTECTYLAAYGTTSDGDNVIKDIKCENVTVGKATSDANGNNIATTYETKIDAACIGCRVHATGSTFYEWDAMSTTTENVMYLSLGSGFDRTRVHTALIDCYQEFLPYTYQVSGYNVYAKSTDDALIMSNVFRSVNAQGEILGATKIERHCNLDWANLDTGYTLRSETTPDGTKTIPSMQGRAFHFHTQVQVTIPTTCSQVCWQITPHIVWAGYKVAMNNYSLSITIL